MGARLTRSELRWLILCGNLARPQSPYIWSNIIPNVSVKLFLNEVSIQITLCNVGGPHPNK